MSTPEQPPGRAASRRDHDVDGGEDLESGHRAGRVAARRGRIAGMDADLVILGADPARDVTAFAKVRDMIPAAGA